MRIKHLSYLLLLLVPVWVACSDDPEENPPTSENEQTISGSSFYELEGYENAALGFNTLKPGGLSAPLYVQGKALTGDAYSFVEGSWQRLDAMNELPGASQWTQSVPVAAGKCYWVRHTATLLYTYLKLRVAYIEGNIVGVEYIVHGTEEREAGSGNTNANTPAESQLFVTDYSIPHLNANRQYVEHTVDYGGGTVLNYAMEWDATHRHTAWVAFSFDAENCRANVSRPSEDPYAEDPQLPAGTSPTANDHRSDGFDRGHLVASSDRLYSREANNQTFYYTNISPMMSSFNGGVWTSFEALLQKWARFGDFDKLYVTKGGTLNNLLVNFTGARAGNDGVTPTTDANGHTVRGLACPKYYFMAMLAQKGSQFQAIAFMVEHRDDYGYTYDKTAPIDFVKERILTIDQLEQETGLDFFCNLPDDIEIPVESSYNEAGWAFGN